MSVLALLALLCAPAAAQSTPVGRHPPASGSGTSAPHGAVAGSVVRSKEWVIRRGVNKEEEFIGDVRYESAGTRLTSDWAKFKHADKTWQALGSVVLRRTTSDGAVFIARGVKAEHDEVSKNGFLDPAPGERVQFMRTPVGAEPDRGESGRVTWAGEGFVKMSGGAKAWGPRIELEADEAVYERATGRLKLNGGRPVLRKVSGEWTTALKADKIAATESPKRIEAHGQVVGWMIFKDQNKFKELTK